jgi:formiminotetrahydrofolate cyclodeaminase
MMVDIAEKGNPQAVSDIGVAALMAHSGFRGAAYNVKINLSSIKDEGFKSQVIDEMEGLAQEVEPLAAKVAEIVDSRI